MNTLQQELQGLPDKLQTETLNQYEKLFADGAAEGKTEAELIEKLPNPRLVAAQKRANVRFQNLKSDFRVGNIFTLFIAMFGVVVFNFFMLIPAFVYGAFLFVAYVSSLAVYAAGIITFAASISGVPQMEFKLPYHHHRINLHQTNNQHQHRAGVVTVNISEAGLTVDKGIHRMNTDNSVVSDELNRIEKHASTLTIKNKMQTRHAFIGLGLLLIGTVLLLLCIWMTRWTVIGFGKYLGWNLQLVRSSVRSDN
jgi:uncharacterized membrane protein